MSYHSPSVWRPSPWQSTFGQSPVSGTIASEMALSTTLPKEEVDPYVKWHQTWDSDYNVVLFLEGVDCQMREELVQYIIRHMTYNLPPKHGGNLSCKFLKCKRNFSNQFEWTEHIVSCPNLSAQEIYCNACDRYNCGQSHLASPSHVEPSHKRKCGILPRILEKAKKLLPFSHLSSRRPFNHNRPLASPTDRQIEISQKDTVYHQSSFNSTLGHAHVADQHSAGPSLAELGTSYNETELPTSMPTKRVKNIAELGVK
ncbi:hypothetical protein B0I35DRAFT_443248 [Stachybotrys elegans]|uniref:Uncharacterized protein n=1 Tax=Stachybotrys elegans TaxID=80388 RepID=A0A8K0WKE2_9HYPO|nr:hypothetical protein B0I35DRAFT_443248 [Stachybotrys elegans]